MQLYKFTDDEIEIILSALDQASNSVQAEKRLALSSKIKKKRDKVDHKILHYVCYRIDSYYAPGSKIVTSHCGVSAYDVEGKLVPIYWNVPSFADKPENVTCLRCRRALKLPVDSETMSKLRGTAVKRKSANRNIALDL